MLRYTPMRLTLFSPAYFSSPVYAAVDFYADRAPSYFAPLMLIFMPF